MSRFEGETGWHGARAYLRHRAAEVGVETGAPIARSGGVLFRGTFPFVVVVGTLVLGCAHARERHDRLLPTAAHLGCYDVILRAPLRTWVALPRRIELRPERTEWGDDFVFLAPEVVEPIHLHGHWWRRDETHLHALWTYDLGGVAFDLETTNAGYSGTAVYYCDICTGDDKVAVDLVQVPCSVTQLAAPPPTPAPPVSN
jgi:hypothetical protein